LKACVSQFKTVPIECYFRYGTFQIRGCKNSLLNFLRKPKVGEKGNNFSFVQPDPKLFFAASISGMSKTVKINNISRYESWTIKKL
jgi:hypothetical protein